MTEFSVRYIVEDVDAAADFYTRHLQFEVVMKPVSYTHLTLPTIYSV